MSSSTSAEGVVGRLSAYGQGFVGQLLADGQGVVGPLPADGQGHRSCMGGEAPEKVACSSG